jgi:hypothetical protein
MGGGGGRNGLLTCEAAGANIAALKRGTTVPAPGSVRELEGAAETDFGEERAPRA